jgi:hypothetical protein
LKPLGVESELLTSVDVMVVANDLHSAAFAALATYSKLKELSGFAREERGHITIGLVSCSSMSDHLWQGYCRSQ